MGNKVTKRKTKPKVKLHPTSPEHSSIHDLDEVRRSLEPNIGEAIQDCTALFDFPGYHECDLPFKRGDVLYNVRTLKDRHDWLLATHTESRERGFVPRDYVCQDSVPEYYKNFSKRKREELLLSDGVSEGTYIIKKDGDSHVLDVRYNGTSSSPSPQRKTYKVRQGKDNRFYVTPRKQFDSVTELLQYYQENTDGMCCYLSECLPPPRRTVAARDMDMKMKNFRMDSRLGKGMFGDVYAGMLKEELPVAVKSVAMSRLEVQARTLEQDIKKVAAAFRHDRFVQMLGVCVQDDMLFLITELMPLGCLRDFLRHDKGQTIHFLQCVDIANQICEGMAYIESQGDTFRCLLMCQNILVGETLQIKIKTFPLATEPYSKDTVGLHHLKWTAPECLDNGDFTSKSDVWSFGVVMYEIITCGKLPFQEIEPRHFVSTIKNGYKILKPKSPIEYDEEFWYNIMLRCWELDPVSRPTFTKLQEKFGSYQLKFEQNPSLSNTVSSNFSTIDTSDVSENRQWYLEQNPSDK